MTRFELHQTHQYIKNIKQIAMQNAAKPSEK